MSKICGKYVLISSHKGEVGGGGGGYNEFLYMGCEWHQTQRNYKIMFYLCYLNLQYSYSKNYLKAETKEYCTFSDF